MTTAANIIPLAQTDGTLYSSAVPITFTEADLWGGTGANSPDPIPTTYGEAICAVVQLSINGHIVGNNTYVVMQQDMGDGVWIDLNGLVWTGSDGGATFVFSNGIAGANVLQQTRSVGQPPTPQANFSNQLALGGRIRFVGKTTTVGGSSSLAGTTAGVSVTIRYRLQPLR